MRGWFSSLFHPAGWWGKDAQVAGWFDGDLLKDPVASGPTYLFRGSQTRAQVYKGSLSDAQIYKGAGVFFAP